VLGKKTQVSRCLQLRPAASELLDLSADLGRLLMARVKTALRELARRWRALDEEISPLSLYLGR
jgi:transposase